MNRSLFFVHSLRRIFTGIFRQKGHLFNHKKQMKKNLIIGLASGLFIGIAIRIALKKPLPPMNWKSSKKVRDIDTKFI